LREFRVVGYPFGISIAVNAGYLTPSRRLNKLKQEEILAEVAWGYLPAPFYPSHIMRLIYM
jgi:hypothetical protein